MVGLFIYYSNSTQQTLSHANSSVYSNREWIVYVGGGTPDMSVMSMGFFPEIITIDAGDNITFINNSSEVHTVTFLSGNPPINPFSPEANMRIGGNIYNGSGIVSSGMLLPGENYTLTFTTPGVYIYRGATGYSCVRKYVSRRLKVFIKTHLEP